MATVQEILNNQWNPTFSFKPGRNKPLPSEATFSRNGSAYRFDERQNIKQVTSDDTQRIYEAKQSLRLEGAAAQLFDSPDDFTTGWSLEAASINTESTLKAPGDQNVIVEDSTNDAHGISQSLNAPDGAPVTTSGLVKAKGRDLNLSIRTGDNFDRYNFDLSAEEVTRSDSVNNGDLIDVSIREYGAGWKYFKVSILPNSTSSVERVFIRPLTRDTREYVYDGDGSSGIRLVYAQAEIERFETSPVLGNDRNEETLTLDLSEYIDGRTGTFYIDYTQDGAATGDVRAHIIDSGNETSLGYTDAKTAPFSLRVEDGDVSNPIVDGFSSVEAYSRNKIIVSVDSAADQEFLVAHNGSVTAASGSGGFKNKEVWEINSQNRIPMTLHQFAFEPNRKSVLELETLSSIL